MEEKTYINILIDTIRKKELVLDNLIRLTLEQEDIIACEEPDMDRLEQIFAEKEEQINQLNILDDGFEKIYEYVKDTIQEDRNRYMDQITSMQELIRQITEKSAALSAAEIRNKTRFMNFFASRKKKIKDFKVSRQTASNYYKNFINQQDQALFLDKKK